MLMDDQSFCSENTQHYCPEVSCIRIWRSSELRNFFHVWRTRLRRFLRPGSFHLSCVQMDACIPGGIASERKTLSANAFSLTRTFHLFLCRENLVWQKGTSDGVSGAYLITTARRRAILIHATIIHQITIASSSCIMQPK